MVVKRKGFLVKSLLAVIVLQLVFPLLILLSLCLVRSMQENAIENHSVPLQTITLSAAQFQKMNIQEKGEMTYQEMNYDIKSIRKEGNRYVVLALKDERETFLHRSNEKQLTKSSKSSQQRAKVFSFPLLYCSFFEQEINVLFAAVTPDLNQQKNCHLHVIYFNIISPPPDKVFV